MFQEFHIVLRRVLRPREDTKFWPRGSEPGAFVLHCGMVGARGEGYALRIRFERETAAEALAGLASSGTIATESLPKL